VKPSLSIPLFREINECHEATGFPLRTDLPGFHVFTMDETYPATRQAMPPFRRGFYQITYFESMSDATVRLESRTLAGAKGVLLFSAPEQLLSWVCGAQRERGFMLYVKPEVLAADAHALEEEFPFFRLSDFNVLSLGRADVAGLHSQFERLHSVYNSAHPYRLPTLAALTRALLFDCRALRDRQEPATANGPAGSALVTRFQQLVSECFQHHCSVESYAKTLNVSVDHLSATIKERTGRTPRDFIADRVLLEAKRLLTHTDLNVSEIAEHLQFSEPTHFARFFKRRAGCAPRQFRHDSAPGRPIRTDRLIALTSAA
jgi:AraC family transcriptional regulator, transcriptional activator of pobA